MFTGHDRLHRAFCILSSCMAVAAPSTLGGVFGVMASRPFWHGSFTPPSLIVNAALAGTALLGIVFYLVHRTRWRGAGRGTDLAMRAIRILLSSVIAVVGVLTVWQTIVGLYGGVPGLAEATRTLIGGPLTIPFWGGRVLLGLAVPLALLLLPRTRTPAGLVAASCLALAGTFIDRFVFVAAGQMAPDTAASGMVARPYAGYAPEPGGDLHRRRRRRLRGLRLHGRRTVPGPGRSRRPRDPGREHADRRSHPVVAVAELRAGSPRPTRFVRRAGRPARPRDAGRRPGRAADFGREPPVMLNVIRRHALLVASIAGVVVAAAVGIGVLVMLGATSSTGQVAVSSPVPSPSAPAMVVGDVMDTLHGDCTACHLKPGGGVGTRPIPAVGHPLEGWTDCTACHSPNRLVSTAPGHTGIHADQCLVCHKSETAAAPPRPHADLEVGDCLGCHGSSAPLPASMTGRSEATCWLCHRASNVETPTIPHPLGGNSVCETCHTAGKVGALPVSHAGRPDTTCVACHDAKPLTAPVAPHSLAGLEGKCATCHAPGVSPGPLPSGEPEPSPTAPSSKPPGSASPDQ